ncbi:MAG: hypothetical protein QOJ54_142 [Aliidongia sp.]|jgi:hypothetical protein|nr:hypothetical protein [Aliidongia sp.]
MKPWPRRILITLALAVGRQGAAIWLVPRAIVATFIKRGATTMGLNRANADTLPTADAIEQASMNPAHEHLSKLLDE